MEHQPSPQGLPSVLAGPTSAPPESVTPRSLVAAVGTGERLGPYRLLRQLGEGGMARIYLAEHEKLGRICAIKRLHADHFTDRLTVARFLAEARAIADISHPNLIAAYDVVEEPNEIYLVMEYLDGRDVAQVLRDEGPLSPSRAADIAAQCCDGLSAVHDRNIIHRDLKPENIFLTREPDGSERVKLLDFGVARLMGDRPQELKTRSGLTVGTPTYMSPEQATASEIDARSDIYTLGVVLYEMLAGAPPFTGAGYGDVMLMHVNDPPPLLSTRRPDVPSRIEQVVMRCLEKDPAARYQSATDLAEALRTTSPTQRMPVISPRNPRPSRQMAAQSTQRRRWLWMGGVVVGVGALLGVVAVTLFPSPSSSPSGVNPAPVGAANGGAALPAPGGAALPAPPPRDVAPPVPPPILIHDVRVETVPAGAEVLVAGITQGSTPCTIKLPDGKGTVEIIIQGPGLVEERRLIDLANPPNDLRLSLRADRKSGRSASRSRTTAVAPHRAAKPPRRAKAPRPKHPGARPNAKSEKGATVDPFAP